MPPWRERGFRMERIEISSADRTETFWPEMTQAEILKTGIAKGMDLSKLAPKGYSQGQLKIIRDRCFIGPVWEAKGSDGTSVSHNLRPGARWEEMIPQIIHLPGLRGNPERSWPVTAVGPAYPGTFDKYTASVILQWLEGDEAKLADLNADLRLLQLTDGVSAKRLYDVHIL